MGVEQFERFIKEIMGRVAEATSAGQTENQNNNRTLRDKGFNRLGKFAHGKGAWPE